MAAKTISAQVQGLITKFSGNGRKLGYPTANLCTLLDLEDGVYFGFADLDRYVHHPALIFIGTPTTVGDTERRVEAHLLDIPDKDYYDKPITLQIHHFHRSNQTFDSVEKLLQVMKSDEKSARIWFKACKDS